MTPTAREQPWVKGLELQGYKTFASKTTFAFAKTITAIVGPNGSGKSNIADAVRWVLGEQSYSLLRGKKTEDMIFSGSESRSRGGMASAVLTFDNTDAWLPIEFSEVSVGRRAFRDGVNEYLVNGQQVRLREITELLAQSGLAQRTYTIIGQGLVDAVLSLKAEERRKLFEEAAGIGLHRAHREEALRRLEATRRNLERVEDILSEFRPQLRSLERQAKRAQDYATVRKDLDDALRQWYGYHWYHRQGLLAQAREEAERRSRTREQLRVELAALEERLAGTRTKLESLRLNASRAQQQVGQYNLLNEQALRRMEVARERLRWLIDLEAQLLDEEDRSVQEQASLSEDRRRIVRDLEQTGQPSRAESSSERDSAERIESPEIPLDAALLNPLQSAIDHWEAAVAQHAAWQVGLADVERHIQRLTEQLSTVQASREAAEESARQAGERAALARDALDRLRAEPSPREKELAEQWLAFEASRNELDAKHASLVEMEREQARLETALELRNRPQEEWRAAVMRLLGRPPAGSRPVSLDGDGRISTSQIPVSGARDGDRQMAELEALKVRHSTLSGNLAVRRDEIQTLGVAIREAGRALQSAEKRRAERFETLGGVQRELDDARRAEEVARRVLEVYAQRVGELKTELDERRSERDAHRARGDLTLSNQEKSRRALFSLLSPASVSPLDQSARDSLASRDEARRRVQFADLRRKEIESKSVALASRQAQIQERLKTLREDRLKTQEEIDQAQAERERLEKQAATLLEATQPGADDLSLLDQQRPELERDEARLRSALQLADTRLAQSQIELARRNEELASLRGRIEDDFGLVAFDHEPEVVLQEPLPFEGLVERLPRVDQIPAELEVQVNRLRMQLRRMGAVNPQADREFLAAKERVDFLTTQSEDLNQAEGQVQQVIAELDVLMDREFRRTFDLVAGQFREIFARLFGGGSARLRMTDPADPVVAGIEIEARLPGRRAQSLAMLSGGERSLTACALIFALLKVSPTPFCVLDEVDAMLDEANVARFRDLLKELGQRTQIVVITHNRLTVQAAEAIYGVSMGPDSASQVISLKLDEAEKAIARMR
ncbi:MAG TPA: AAA family ATPase [Anaerolineales bacterium]|nr:AAA family ATPase [Anaerolineales bacterium]